MRIRHNFTWFSARVTHASLQMPGVASALTKRATVLLADEIVRGGALSPGTPWDTGAARWSWTALPGGRGRAKPFTPQRAPDQHGDAAMALITQAVEESAPNETYFLLATNCPYMAPLEYGHSTQAPAGMIRNALAGWDLIVRQAAEDVRAGYGATSGNDWGEGGGDGSE